MTRSEYFVDRETLKEIGHELWKIRQEKRFLLYQVQSRTRIPERIIDGIETGRHLNYGVVRKLINFYGKKNESGVLMKKSLVKRRGCIVNKAVFKSVERPFQSRRCHPLRHYIQYPIWPAYRH